MSLREKLENIELQFDDLFYERCEKYRTLLQQWGKIHNLTASLKTEEIEENIVDSIYPLKFLDNFDSLLDVGTGAGYPGVLLAIARPESKVVLVEPRAKRVAFLHFVKSALKLENVFIEQKRVEDLEESAFDIITSRAVTNTTLLLELTSHLTDENTQYLFYKGSLCDEEIKDANIKNALVFKVGEHRNYLYMRNREL
ncbi:MAG: 16S rRNA (guanine(527)-N(7))-methyltransferase RsmG [Arcobacter sp.]|nr:MAG: 16S rRNA (guanine(527)-N(7))-methyltransferase RsmG [Arcobacter sp.]